MRRGQIAQVTVGLVGLAFTGCEISFFCVSAGAPGLVVEVVAATSGTPLDGAAGEVRDGEFSATLTASSGSDAASGSTLSAAIDRPGTYTVSVWRAGYARWGANGVTIVPASGGCSTAHPVRLVATLQPTG